MKKLILLSLFICLSLSCKNEFQTTELKFCWKCTYPNLNTNYFCDSTEVSMKKYQTKSNSTCEKINTNYDFYNK